jgi:hypothetical protein
MEEAHCYPGNLSGRRRGSRCLVWSGQVLQTPERGSVPQVDSHQEVGEWLGQGSPSSFAEGVVPFQQATTKAATRETQSGMTCRQEILLPVHGLKSRRAWSASPGGEALHVSEVATLTRRVRSARGWASLGLGTATAMDWARAIEETSCLRRETGVGHVRMSKQQLGKVEVRTA